MSSSTAPTVVVLVGAPGVGKRTLQEYLLTQYTADFEPIVRTTTRAPRPGEKDKRDYHFRAIDDFRMAEMAGVFVETATVDGDRYGTQRSELVKPGIKLHVCGMDSAEAFHAAHPRCAVVVLVPPSSIEHARRLSRRWPGEAQAPVRVGAMEEAERINQRVHTEPQRRSPRFHVVTSDADAPEAVLRLAGVVNPPLHLHLPFP